MKEFSKLFGELVNLINTKIGIDSIVVTGNTSKIYTCNTRWARVGKQITLTNLNVPFNTLITEVVLDQYIVVNTNLPFDLVNVNSPINITGTKIATNLEWTKITNFISNKTPLIWLLDSYDQTTFGRESSIERIVDMKIFFLDETDIKNYYTSDHKLQVIQPLLKLKDSFFQVLQNNYQLKYIESERIKDFSRFGTETAEGFDKNILDANLSGFVVSLQLTKFKDNEVNCECNT